MQHITRQLDAIARAILPFLTGMTATLLIVVPFGIPHLSSVMPMLVLMVVFYWSLHQPHFMPPLAAFSIGLFQDILIGTPLGANALLFVFVRSLVAAQRRFFVGKSFIYSWQAFAIIALLASLLLWGINSYYEKSLLPWMPVLTQLILTLAIFPAMVWMMTMIKRHLIEEQG